MFFETPMNFKKKLNNFLSNQNQQNLRYQTASNFSLNHSRPSQSSRPFTASVRIVARDNDTGKNKEY